jgi:hypothetical protein
VLRVKSADRGRKIFKNDPTSREYIGVQEWCVDYFGALSAYTVRDALTTRRA